MNPSILVDIHRTLKLKLGSLNERSVERALGIEVAQVRVGSMAAVQFKLTPSRSYI